MAKQIQLHCSPAILARIVAALEFYVQTNFPPGSSDCGQVAREELLKVVEAFQQQLAAQGAVQYNRRLAAMVKEAMRIYCESLQAEDGQTHGQRCAVLQAACKGVEQSDDDWQSAQLRDQSETY